MTCRCLLGLAILFATTSGLAATQVRELVVIVNSGNRARPSSDGLEAAFLRRDRTWSDNTPIIPINAPVDHAERRTFDRVVLGMSPDEAARYWLDQRIRGAGSAPREVADIYLAVKLVARMRGAIAYVPADTELQGVTVIARIRDDKLHPP